jgi:hypothetical protein
MPSSTPSSAPAASGRIPGPVYRVSVTLPSGVVIHSKPMSVEECTRIVHSTIPGTKTVHYLGPRRAQAELEALAHAWRRSAEILECYSAGPTRASDQVRAALDVAERFAALARRLKSKL